MPFVPVSLGDMTWSKTGSWRYMRPIYEDKTPPCNQACPAGIDIVRFLMLIGQGKTRDAWFSIREESPFPGVCGRVCPHPCEDECNRSRYDEPVSINALERFVADAARRFTRRDVEANGMKTGRIAVIGSGPAGLTCAYHLARLGYTAEVFEALPAPGGILRYGIPEYRLPAHVLNREIAEIESVGVKIRLETRIDQGFLSRHGGDYQAIFVATGAHKSLQLAIPDEKGPGVIPGLTFLRNIRMGTTPKPGKRVAVIGGGNTALDAARSALRLGSQPLVLYRRGEDEMPAFAAEFEEALDEGIDIRFLTQPVRIMRQNGRFVGLECVKMRLGDVDRSGRKRPIPIEDSSFTLDVDGVLVAVGETPETDLVDDWEAVSIDDASGSEETRILFGGDLVASQRTVAHAIGSGKKAAIAIDASLSGENPQEALEASQIGETGGVSMRKHLDPAYRALNRHVVSFDELNTAYFERRRRTERLRVPASVRIRDFREVNRNFSRLQARYEAERCFSCGTCNECENCYVFCPDVSILRDMRKLKHAINYDQCKGCGICFTECPRRAISMVEEER
jgi:2-oxoacid:acceptor oxidoreductase delta subunit (pyruvate/2-ketoisovalerate family)